MGLSQPMLNNILKPLILSPHITKKECALGFKERGETKDDRGVI